MKRFKDILVIWQWRRKYNLENIWGKIRVLLLSILIDYTYATCSLSQPNQNIAKCLCFNIHENNFSFPATTDCNLNLVQNQIHNKQVSKCDKQQGSLIWKPRKPENNRSQGESSISSDDLQLSTPLLWYSVRPIVREFMFHPRYEINVINTP